MKHNIELTSEQLRAVLAAIDCHWGDLLDRGLDIQADRTIELRNEIRDQWSDSLHGAIFAK